MVGIGDEVDGPVGTQLLQGVDVESTARVAIADDDVDRDTDGFHFGIGDGELAEFAETDCQGFSFFIAEMFLPELLN